MAGKITQLPPERQQKPQQSQEIVQEQQTEAPKTELQMRAEQEMQMLQRTAEYKQMQAQMKPKIDSEAIRKASETLRKYKEGKARLILLLETKGLS